MDKAYHRNIQFHLWSVYKNRITPEATCPQSLVALWATISDSECTRRCVVLRVNWNDLLGLFFKNDASVTCTCTFGVPLHCITV
jgi:hypothetical protein